MFLNVSTEIPWTLRGEPVILAAIGAELAKQLADLLRQPHPPIVDRMLRRLDEPPDEPYWRRFYG